MSQCNNVTCNIKGEGELAGKARDVRCKMKMEDVRLARWRDGAAVKGIPMEDGRWKMEDVRLARWSRRHSDGRWKM
ncbi:MAG: hypothetical protein K6F94_01240 [Bacteroidaceae bacterium]|nr:hypothetical protein [Bacteroidaceae bacterium]